MTDCYIWCCATYVFFFFLTFKRSTTQLIIHFPSNQKIRTGVESQYIDLFRNLMVRWVRDSEPIKLWFYFIHNPTSFLFLFCVCYKQTSNPNETEITKVGFPPLLVRIVPSRTLQKGAAFRDFAEGLISKSDDVVDPCSGNGPSCGAQ